MCAYRDAICGRRFDSVAGSAGGSSASDDVEDSALAVAAEELDRGVRVGIRGGKGAKRLSSMNNNEGEGERLG